MHRLVSSEGSAARRPSKTPPSETILTEDRRLGSVYSGLNTIEDQALKSPEWWTVRPYAALGRLDRPGRVVIISARWPFITRLSQANSSPSKTPSSPRRAKQRSVPLILFVQCGALPFWCRGMERRLPSGTASQYGDMTHTDTSARLPKRIGRCVVKWEIGLSGAPAAAAPVENSVPGTEPDLTGHARAVSLSEFLSKVARFPRASGLRGSGFSAAISSRSPAWSKAVPLEYEMYFQQSAPVAP